MFDAKRSVGGMAVLACCLAISADAVAQRGRGPDSQFSADREVFQWLLRKHHLITRDVKEIPQGVETRTESEDPEVAVNLREHVTAMAGRVEKGRGFHYRDPLFAALFRHADEIEVHIEPTAKGVLVRETGTSPAAVQLIRAHARVVSQFVERGFEEVHRNHAVPDFHAEESPVTGHDIPTHCEIFAEFDRVYIPALALTNQGKLSASRQALQRLRRHWESSQQHIESALGADDAWDVASVAVQRSLDAATRDLEGEQPMAAHESLEPIREVMTAARRLARIEYPLDLLTDFHATMELIAKPAAERSPGQLDREYLDRLPGYLSRAVLQWRRVENTSFAPVLSGMDPGRSDAIGAQIQSVRVALIALREAMAHNDREATVRAAKGLKPPFAQLYMSFGDFRELGT